MKKIALISAILESPSSNQADFNKIVSDYKHIIKGRMGLPFDDDDIAVIALTVCGTMDEINALTGKLGTVPNSTVKTAVSKKEVK